MTRKAEIFLFLCLLVFTGFFASYRLSESPSVWYDEGLYVQSAMNVVEGHGANFRFAPDQIAPIPALTVGYPLIYPLALVFKIFGSTILAARSMMVAWILALIASGYLLIRKRYGAVMALWSLALVATFPPLYGNGKSVLGEVPGLVFLTLSLLSYGRLMSARADAQRLRWVSVVLTGLCAGLCAATKPLFLLFLPSLAVVASVEWRRGRLSWREILTGGLCACLPLVLWLFLQFHSAGSLHTILTFYANPSGVGSIFSVIGDNIRNFFTETGPIYLLIMMVVWLAAVVIKKIKRAHIPAEEIIALSFSVLVSLAYLRIVGWHRYLFPAQIVAMFYFVPSLAVCVRYISEKIKKPIISGWLQRISVPLTVAVLSLWGIYGLMFHSWVADFYSSHKTAFWEQHFKDAPLRTRFFFYDAPEVAIFSLSGNYYQYLDLSSAGGPFGAEWLPSIKNGAADEIVIRTDTLEALPAKNEWLVRYYPALQAYKYTILRKRL